MVCSLSTWNKLGPASISTNAVHSLLQQLQRFQIQVKTCENAIERNTIVALFSVVLLSLLEFPQDVFLPGIQRDAFLFSEFCCGFLFARQSVPGRLNCPHEKCRRSLHGFHGEKSVTNGKMSKVEMARGRLSCQDVYSVFK